MAGTALKKKAMEAIKKLPEEKIRVALDSIDYLKEKESFDFFTREERGIIRSSRKDAINGKGIEWRKIRTTNV